MLRSSLSLAVIAAACASLLVLVHAVTGERIVQNQRAHEQRLIRELAGAAPPAATSWSADVWNLCNGRLLARAEIAGYGGPISLLIAGTLTPEGLRLRGLRITGHQETPGLADFLQHPERGWLGALAGRYPDDLSAVDTVAGATITSRAVLRGVSRALLRTEEYAATARGCPS